MTKSRSTLVLILSTCSALPVAHADLFSTKAPRGQSRVEYTSPGKVDEVCIIPKGFPGLEADAKELEKLQKLCAFDFYGPSGEKKDIITASCPKLTSTNPGVEIEEVPAGTSVADYVANECVKDANRSGKKLAKFKQSISCSYAPAILSYYQVAAALGGSIEVPGTVIRTMDLAEHRKITALALPNSKDTIHDTWVSWKSAEADPKNYKKKERLFTDDFEQIYGALSKNPGGELKYSEINAGLKGFKNSKGWENVRNSAPIAKMVKADLASAAQTMIQMKDISNFLVMDYILSQQDRFGNIHAVEMYYAFDGKDVKKRKKKNDKDVALAGEIVVKELLLKDNDCGMRPDDNVAKNEKMLQAIRHMAPKNYKKLLEFAAAVKTPEVASYFQTEMLATSDDVKTVQKNTADAVTILQAACKSGDLKLDLDLEGYLAGKDLSKSECE